MFTLFHPVMGTGRQVFATCLTVLPPSLTQGKTQASGQICQGAISSGIALPIPGPWEAVVLGAWYNGT
jgi:hypothetical protein